MSAIIAGFAVAFGLLGVFFLFFFWAVGYAAEKRGEK